MKNTLPATPRQERIYELEISIRNKEDTIFINQLIQELCDKGIPKEEFSEVTDVSSFIRIFEEHKNEKYRLLFSNHAFGKIFGIHKLPLTLAEKVLQNIETTRKVGFRLLGSTDADPAYKTLIDIQDFISYHPGALEGSEGSEGYDPATIEMGKEWANNFIEGLRGNMENREGFPDIVDGEEGSSDLSMEQQYDLLVNISAKSLGVKSLVIERLCRLLPSCPGQSFYWNELQDIVHDVNQIAIVA